MLRMVSWTVHSPVQPAGNMTTVAGVDLDHLAVVGPVSGAPGDEMAELVARDRQPPAARRAHPDAAFRLVVRPLVDEPAGGMRGAFERVGLDAPVDEVGRGVEAAVEVRGGDWHDVDGLAATPPASARPPLAGPFCALHLRFDVAASFAFIAGSVRQASILATSSASVQS